MKIQNLECKRYLIKNMKVSNKFNNYIDKEHLIKYIFHRFL
jgi:hypothetical protein